MSPLDPGTVQLWAVPAEPGRWRLMRGEHRGTHYVETTGATTYTEAEALRLLTTYAALSRYRAATPEEVAR